MNMNINGIDCEVFDFDGYLEDFEERMLPEFKGEAEGKFFEAFEQEDLESGEGFEVRIRMPEEITKDKKPIVFVFYCSFNEVEECPVVINYLYGYN